MQASITLPANRAAPTAARRWVDEVGRALEAEMLDDLRLVVTELVTVNEGSTHVWFVLGGAKR
jgi:hypothetical protein